MGHTQRILTGLFLIFLSGCKISNESVIPGRYVGSYGEVSAMVELKEDHTYTQTLRIKDRPPISRTGTWRYSDIMSSLYFDSNYIYPFDGFGNLSQDFDKKFDGSSMCEVSKFLGSVTLGSSEEVLRLRKQ